MKKLWQWVLSLFKAKAEEKIEDVAEHLAEVSVSDAIHAVEDAITHKDETVKAVKEKVTATKKKAKAKATEFVETHSEEMLNKLSKAAITELASTKLGVKLNSKLNKSDLITSFLKAQAEKNKA